VDPSATGALEAAIAAGRSRSLRSWLSAVSAARRCAGGGPIEGKPLTREVLRRVFRPRGFEHRVISHVDIEPPNLP
jgi:hypothetical protein